MSPYTKAFLWLLATGLVAVTQMVNLIDFDHLTRSDVVRLFAAFVGTMAINLAALLDMRHKDDGEKKP